MLTPDLLEPLRVTVEAALDRKAFQVAVLDVSELTSFTDGFVICSAANLRQLGAIADEVGRRLRTAGRRALHVEGTPHSEWLLLDYGDFVVHLFTEDKRAYYALDGLWADAPRLSPADLGADQEPPARG